jgi:hypothetical protein
MKYALIASFSDGIIIERNSKTAFAWAWAAYGNDKYGQISRGFASTQEKAMKAARAFFPAKQYTKATYEVVATTVSE